MAGISLITPTSDRPLAFVLCEHWMKRAMESIDEEVEWIVVDDGRTPVCCTMGQKHIRRRHDADKTKSFLGNLRAGLINSRYDKILFIEDDDWYSPQYLREMSAKLNRAVLVGESRAKYYNLKTRCYHEFGNDKHASLCQTGIHRKIQPWLKTQVEKRQRHTVDFHLWRTGQSNHWTCDLSDQSRFCVGIKGIPGKVGIGKGHVTGKCRTVDSDGSILRRWVGPVDAEVYLSLAENFVKIE